MSAPLRILTAALGEERAKVALAELEKAGWVCVPRQPTEAMIEAAYWSAYAENAAGVWTKMVGASPSE